MNGTTFDTLSAARDLEAAGFDRVQAEALAAAIRSGQGDLATKMDIAQLDNRLNMLQWVVGIRSAVTLATFAIVAAKLL